MLAFYSPSRSVANTRSTSRGGLAANQLDREVLVAPNDVVDGPCRRRGQLDALHPGGESAQHRARLEPGQTLAGAGMRALPEAELTRGIPTDVERLGGVPFAFVAVGRGVDDEHPGARRDGGAADLGVVKRF